MEKLWILVLAAALLVIFSGVGEAQKATSATEFPTTPAVAVSVGATSAGCTDSDEGLNYYVQGTTAGLNGAKWDKCVDSSGNYNYNWLREYYCTSSGYVDSVEYQCLDGCIDGACKNLYGSYSMETATVSMTPTAGGNEGQTPAMASTPHVSPATTVNGCTDTDGGQDFFTQGTVTDKGGTQKTDFCVVGGLDQELREYYCQDNGYVASVDVVCVDKCEKGACTGQGYLQTNPADYVNTNTG